LRQRFENSAANELGRVFRHLNRSFGEALKRHGLSALQANMLMELWLQGPLSVGALQRHMALASSSLSGALDRMERAGLVRRTPSPGDRRSFVIEPANWDKDKKQAVMETLVDTEDDFFTPLSRSERQQLLTLLRKIGKPAP
jgi:DNA-binding MarR family transcriptional regulator